MGGAAGWRRVARAAWDLALAVACAQLAVVLTREYSGAMPAGVRLAALTVAVAHPAALLVRRRWPQAVTGWLLATAVAYRALGLAPMLLGPAGLVVLYTVTVRTPRSTSLRWTAAAVATAVVGGVGLLDWDSVVLNAALLAGAWVVGSAVRRRQEDATAHAARADLLERAREELAHHAVTQERVRIARELHDVVAHSLSVVALQAGTGRLVARHDPDAAQQALATVETVARDAVAEMRQLLAVLRDADAPDTLAPLPRLADLPQVAARVAEAGVAVEVRVEGTAAEPLPRGLELAAYRIVQEALTNTLKHSAATSATVVVAHADHALTVTVRDPGPAKPRAAGDPGPGSGLVGMRERVALYAGTLRTGPTGDGGFAVEARLPTGGANR